MVRNCSRFSAVGDASRRRRRSARSSASQIGSRMCFSMRAGAMSPGGGIVTVSRAANSAVPNTRRIGWAKLAAVYCVCRASDRESRNPRPARGAPRARRSDASRSDGQPGRGRDEQEDQQPVVGTAAAAIGTIDSQGSASCVGIRAPTSACATGASASITRARAARRPAGRARRSRTSRRSEKRSTSLRLRRGRACAAGRGR